MGNTFLKDLPILLEKGIITDDIADNIKLYYKRKEPKTSNALQIILGVLGALLVGLGILLILAHNWDQFSKTFKTILAFIPLIVAQGLTIFVILKKQNDKMWQEGVGVFIYVAIAISISLISQIYHINGEFSGFMLIWMILALPMVYILDSYMVSLLYIGGISVFVLNSYNGSINEFYYFPLLLLIMPFYYKLIKSHWNSNATYFHHWAIPLSLTSSLIIFGEANSDWLPVVFISLFGIFYNIGKIYLVRYNSYVKNAYLPIGLIGTMIVLFLSSFEDFWEHLFRWNGFSDINRTSIAAITFILLAIGTLIYKSIKREKVYEPISYAFLYFAIVFISFMLFNFDRIVPIILINLFILYIGVYYIRLGEAVNDLVTLNIGLLIITILILMRFFDYDISFLIRGLIFILLGIGFFVANFLMLKKRRQNNLNSI